MKKLMLSAAVVLGFASQSNAEVSEETKGKLIEDIKTMACEKMNDLSSDTKAHLSHIMGNVSEEEMNKMSDADKKLHDVISEHPVVEKCIMSFSAVTENKS